MEGDSGTPGPGSTATVAVAPVILGVDFVTCTPQQSATDTWDIQLGVDDPQGADTVGDGEYHVFDVDGDDVWDDIIVCAAGTCYGAFRFSQNGIGCDQAGVVSMTVS